MIITKNHLVTRDLDLLGELARHDAAAVYLSVTTLDASLARTMEPRTSQPARRLTAIEALARAGVPTGVMVAPVIPGLTDHEMPAIIAKAAKAGARFAGYILLRCATRKPDCSDNRTIDNHRYAAADGGKTTPGGHLYPIHQTARHRRFVIVGGRFSGYSRRVGFVLGQCRRQCLAVIHAFEGDQMTAFINHGDAHGDTDFLGFRLGTAYKNGRVVI